MEEKAKKIAELLKVLANEHRLLILCALMKGCLTVGEIHKYCPAITASALSQHLHQLRAAGILDSEKQGMNVGYREEGRPGRRKRKPPQMVAPAATKSLWMKGGKKTLCRLKKAQTRGAG